MDPIGFIALFLSGGAIGWALRAEVEEFRRDPVMVRVRELRADMRRIQREINRR